MLDKFDHQAAQDYEITYAKQWLQQSGADIWQTIDTSKTGVPKVHPLILNEFFQSDDEIWDSFAENIRGKSILDIGTGPVPTPSLWHWAGAKYAIDPLSVEYDRLCREIFGRSWYDDVDARTDEAEILQRDLVGKINGVIVCRNCLDHCREPYLILANISAYAATGCALMLWTDLYHLDGHDHGHTDITCDRDGFRRVVEAMGFKIIREVPVLLDRPTVQFGCFAIKK
jgi:hypothetical protein